ncbi:MAG: AAA family ATPase [Patescibacteria group bacterium]|nr:AAA family ATPase [Patescibacteria group bacterium]
MYLEKLEIQGFKSFANPVELVFNRQLTAIVGPNGSGKSNVADAVRWVLGEQSNKTLRSKKAEDVIFAGSDKKSRLGFAQVSLFLNNAGRQADLDYDQVVVSRRVERNGESEYLINNNKVRLLDVQLLLAKANFGQKTYSVIGQGTVDSILLSSAQERKEFFDEATGVKQFQIKKSQSENKLTAAKENLAQGDKILAELEPRLRSLTRQVRKLEKREKLQVELRQKQTDYYSFLSFGLSKDLKEKKEICRGLEKEASDLNQKLVEIQTALDKESRASSRQEVFEELRRQLAAGQEKINSLLKKKAVLEGQGDLKLIAKGQGDLVWLGKRGEEIERALKNSQNLLAEKERAAQKAIAELATLEENRARILLEFQELEDKLLNQDLPPQELAKKMEDICRQQDDFEKSLATISSLEELSALRDACRRLNHDLQELYGRIKNNSDKDRSLWQKEFNQLLSTKDNLVSEISGAKTKKALLESDCQRLQEEIKNLQAERTAVQKDKKLLAGQSDADSDLAGQLAELDKVIAQEEVNLQKSEEEIKNFNQEEENKRRQLLEAQKDFQGLQNSFNQKNSHLGEIKVELARLETRQEELNKEISQEAASFDLRPVDDLNPEKSKAEILSLKNQLAIIGGIDEEVIDEYKEVKERYDFLKNQSEDLKEAISHLEKIIKDLDQSIASQFDQAFKNINKYFSEYFKKLFNGGKAELILNIEETKSEKNNSAEEGGQVEIEIKKQYGIEIKATPPGKKLSSINMLSGGEKALTSIALICAIIANNPSPFVVLDEVDAALDEANSIRFTEILGELSSKTQFITITHNRATMYKAKIIYGVTMDDEGVSRLLSMSFEAADEIAA